MGLGRIETSLGLGRSAARRCGARGARAIPVPPPPPPRPPHSRRARARRPVRLRRRSECQRPRRRRRPAGESAAKRPPSILLTRADRVLGLDEAKAALASRCTPLPAPGVRTYSRPWCAPPRAAHSATSSPRPLVVGQGLPRRDACGRGEPAALRPRRAERPSRSTRCDPAAQEGARQHGARRARRRRPRPPRAALRQRRRRFRRPVGAAPPAQGETVEYTTPDGDDAMIHTDRMLFVLVGSGPAATAFATGGVRSGGGDADAARELRARLRASSARRRQDRVAPDPRPRPHPRAPDLRRSVLDDVAQEHIVERAVKKEGGAGLKDVLFDEVHPVLLLGLQPPPDGQPVVDGQMLRSCRLT